jgi:hypothetical protein
MASKATKSKKRAKRLAKKQQKAMQLAARGLTTPPGVPIPQGGTAYMVQPNSFPLGPSPYGCGPQLGWPALLNALSVMAQTGRWAYALDGNSEVQPLTAYPQMHIHSTVGSLQAAVRIALRGSGGFNIVTATAPTPVVADLSVNLGAVRSFGVRVTLTNSINAFRFSVYKLNVLDNATIQTELFLRAPRIPADVLILSVNNINGFMTIVELAIPVVTIVFATSPSLAAGDTLSVATLTLRDLGMPPNATMVGGIA